MKQIIKRIVFAVFWLLFHWLGFEALTDAIQLRVFVYKRRLNIVPVSYKLFLVSLGAVLVFSWQVAIENLDAHIGAGPAIDIVQPVLVVHAEAAPAIEKVTSIDTLADLVWSRESSRGVNNYSQCEKVGKVNGIGYGIPGNGDYMCFESHEEEMTVLRGWLTAKRAAGMSDKEMFCLYSGSNYSECKR